MLLAGKIQPAQRRNWRDWLWPMTLTLILEQTFNGLQAGVTLFLVAAGLTLILGIMDFVFLAHGAQVMIGAYAAAAITQATGNFFVGLGLAIPITFASGYLL